MKDTYPHPLEETEPKPTLSLIRYHMGQAALNILIRPDDAPAIEHELDLAARITQAYTHRPDCHEATEQIQQIVADGHTLRSIQNRRNNIPSSSQEEPQEEPDDSSLVWIPTTDGYGYTATKGETIYVVHTAGPRSLWRCGVGDGATTEWLDRQFPDDESARGAAQALSDAATSSETTYRN